MGFITEVSDFPGVFSDGRPTGSWKQRKKVLNAERIYRILTAWELEEKELLKLEQEFYQDDHRYWENQKPDQKPSPQMNQKWQEINEEMETDLETFSKEASRQTGDFLDQVKIENRKRQDYREFLRKFAVFREEIGVDPDTFDYTFYSYGLQMYGNMPLIEPQETKEVKKSCRICDCDRHIHVLFPKSGTKISGRDIWHFV